MNIMTCWTARRRIAHGALEGAFEFVERAEILLLTASRPSSGD
jgi:hypothetical protein